MFPKICRDRMQIIVELHGVLLSDVSHVVNNRICLYLALHQFLGCADNRATEACILRQRLNATSVRCVGDVCRDGPRQQHRDWVVPSDS